MSDTLTILQGDATERRNAATLINQDSGNTEFYTPHFIIHAARRVLGHIDLDPASCELANQTIQASKIFTTQDDGLKHEWRGKVWMNHPFDKKHNPAWIAKLTGHFYKGEVTEALCICYASTSEKWFRPLLAFPQCFPNGRINYLDATGKPKLGVTKGSVITYLGLRLPAFYAEFSHIGTIKVPYRPHE